MGLGGVGRSIGAEHGMGLVWCVQQQRTRQHDAVLAEDADAGARVVDGLDCVLHLVQPPYCGRQRTGLAAYWSVTVEVPLGHTYIHASHHHVCTILGPPQPIHPSIIRRTFWREGGSGRVVPPRHAA